MELPRSEQLNIGSLSRIFDNKAECYKLFWFDALLNRVCNGETEIIFEKLIDDMIASAWYMVTEYHLNLGPRDTLEKTVNYISSSTSMPPAINKSVILKWLLECSDPVVQKYKRDLTLNVPYRLQAPFLEGFHSDTWNCGSREIIHRINQQQRLIYYFSQFDGLNTKILIDGKWAEYLRENQEILRGWIQFNMILYLQRRNPSVPGISDKLYPPQERKLDKIKKYWAAMAKLTDIHEIYAGNIITEKNISIDHFVPWSYVAHDEFWNLHPTTRAINSSKSNHLPDWDVYFPRFAEIEYRSYSAIWTYDQIHNEFQKCAKDHLNNPEIGYRLYQEGLDKNDFKERLQNVVYPVYLSAKTCGFSSWKCTL